VQATQARLTGTRRQAPKADSGGLTAVPGWRRCRPPTPGRQGHDDRHTPTQHNDREEAFRSPLPGLPVSKQGKSVMVRIGPTPRETNQKGENLPPAASGSTCNSLQQLPLVPGASRQARLVPSSQRAIVEWTGKSVMVRIGPTPFPDKGGAVLPARSRTLACARVDLRRGNSSRGGLPPQY
jgi:hypothetical protein